MRVMQGVSQVRVQEPAAQIGRPLVRARHGDAVAVHCFSFADDGDGLQKEGEGIAKLRKSA